MHKNSLIWASQTKVHSHHVINALLGKPTRALNRMVLAKTCLWNVSAGYTIFKSDKGECSWSSPFWRRGMTCGFRVRRPWMSSPADQLPSSAFLKQKNLFLSLHPCDLLSLPFSPPLPSCFFVFFSAFFTSQAAFIPFSMETQWRHKKQLTHNIPIHCL